MKIQKPEKSILIFAWNKKLKKGKERPPSPLLKTKFKF